MKTLFTFLFLSFATLTLAQDNITLCHTPAADKFAIMASSKEFKAAHLAPRQYTHESQAGGRMIRYKTPDGGEANAFLIESKAKSNSWIFVFQEWWGLNDNIKRQAEELYNALGNVNVLALDMYDGKLATDAQTAGKYMGEFKQERGDAIVKGALGYAGSDARVGTVGWCFGGGQSLQATLTAGKQGVACVMYYGMPEENVERLKNLNTDVLNIWPTQDKWINKEVMDKFEANMKAAGKKLTIKSYEADHAFANPSNPRYNQQAAADAFQNTVTFFKERLK